ncbi:hypothetical protein F7725_019104 [Dissostichus mawsoni]|uniref:Uncharacterized protein n=1 Tax=Dissostichus mawsoni TaxID=36200 RepID=A0A7J5XV32_DISMA|nr:hypothetical protein F7725_019104 [Dissostichus mawsoni]
MGGGGPRPPSSNSGISAANSSSHGRMEGPPPAYSERSFYTSTAITRGGGAGGPDHPAAEPIRKHNSTCQGQGWPTRGPGVKKRAGGGGATHPGLNAVCPLHLVPGSSVSVSCPLHTPTMHKESQPELQIREELPLSFTQRALVAGCMHCGDFLSST